MGSRGNNRNGRPARRENKKPRRDVDRWQGDHHEERQDERLRGGLGTTNDLRLHQAPAAGGQKDDCKLTRPPLEPRTAGQASYVNTLRSNTVTICHGPTGSGKTFLAVGDAIRELFNETSPIQKILFVRPCVAAVGENLGFLPGNLTQKIDPYMRPLMDALHHFCPDSNELIRLFRSGAVEMWPLAHMRGLTFHNTYMILDEAQNTLPPQMELFLTRLGKGSKAVASGDLAQTDLEYEYGCEIVNGLEVALAKFQQKINRGGFTTGKVAISLLDKADVVRHPLIAELSDCLHSELEVPTGCNGRNGHARTGAPWDGDPRRFTLP